MPYETGYWGEQAKERSKRRLAYFRTYHRKNAPPPKYFRLGEFGELLAQRKMYGSKLVNQTSHDLEWNGQRIEVKTSQSPSMGNRYLFDISIQKREGKTDYFLVLMLEERTKELRHAYLIPDKAITAKTHLRISPEGRSKYNYYRLRLKPTYD
jgi:hypothetical protein